MHWNAQPIETVKQTKYRTQSHLSDRHPAMTRGHRKPDDTRRPLPERLATTVIRNGSERHVLSTIFTGCRSVGLRVLMLKIFCAFQISRCMLHGSTTWSGTERRHRSRSLVPTRPHSTPLDPTRPYSSLLVPTRPYSSLLVPTRPYSTLLVPTRPYSSLLVSTHTHSYPLVPYSSPLVPTRPHSSLLIPTRPLLVPYSSPTRPHSSPRPYSWYTTQLHTRKYVEKIS